MAYDSSLRRLPDPTTNPVGPGFVSLTLTDNAPGMLHNLNHGGSIGVSFAGNYWTINIGYPQLTISEGNQIIPFLNSLRGVFKNFYVQLPQYVNPASGVWDTTTDAKVALGEISIGSQSDSIVIPSWSSRGGDCDIGDMLKFDNSNKIYQIVDTDLTSDTKTIYLNCDIIEKTKVSTASLEMNDIKFRVRQEGNTPANTLKPDGLYDAINLTLRENII